MSQVRKSAKRIKKKTDGNALFLRSKDLTEETEVRVLPPTDSLNGLFYMERNGWWLNGKFYLTNDTFGGDDVFEEEIDAARAEGDEELDALINAKKAVQNGSYLAPVLRKDYTYPIAILHLNCNWSDDEGLDSFDVIDEMCKIHYCKPTLFNAINAVVCSRQFQVKADDGFTDREEGLNITLSKTGSGRETEYGATGWREAIEMDARFYEGGKDAIDLYAIVSKERKSDEYLRSVIRNYLYGEDLLEDNLSPATAVKKPAPKAAVKKSAPKRSTKVGPSKVSKKGGRSLASDVEDGIDDMDD
jgi:hypothetical protein